MPNNETYGFDARTPRSGGQYFEKPTSAGTDYQLSGKCIYGLNGAIHYRVLDTGGDDVHTDASEDASRMHELASGSMRCDGSTYSRPFRSTVSDILLLQLGNPGPKTVAYLILRRAKT